MKVKQIDETTSLEEYANILKKWMIENEYILVQPEDKTVIFNINMAEYFKPLVYRELDSKKYEEQINNLKLENKKQKEKITELTHLIEGIQDSRSWKITKPIRDFKNIFNRG